MERINRSKGRSNVHCQESAQSNHNVKGRCISEKHTAMIKKFKDSASLSSLD